MSKDVYVYEFGGKVYINLTNKCTNNCDFCVRNHKDGVGDEPLWIKKEPTGKEIIALLQEKGPVDVIFCGYGEPTIRIEVLEEVARYVKSYGGAVRINTNGHANQYHRRNVAAELEGLVDVCSISLNASSKEAYEKICHCVYREEGFEYMLDFARECIKHHIRVILSIVDVMGEQEIQRAREIAQEMGADFRVRTYIP